MFFLLLAVGAWAPALAQPARGIVRQIVVEGAQRIEPDTIRSYLLLQEGDPFDDDRVDRSLKSLFATGLFADVTLRREGDRLMVVVVENPVINRIAFEGNRRLKDEVLNTEISLKPRIIYTRNKVQADVNRILALYRRNGRFAATVEPKVIQLPQNRVDLVFEINEGDVTRVERIRIVGNKEFADSRLRDVIRTKETRWYRLFSADDTYDPDRLTLDRELLRKYYLKNGFADFRVLSAVAELTPDRERFFITFTVDEGARYKFATVGIDTRLRDLTPDQIASTIEFEEGDWYDAEAVDKTSDRLVDAVAALGYPFIDVRPRVERDREAKTIAVTYEVTEGSRVYVERIDIQGNIRTLDKVIRREFRFVEGDAFNAAKLRRSNQRLQNLGFFERVTVDQIPGSAPDKTAVKVDVQEKSTGSLSLGAGFSTTQGALADVGIRERNLLGRGQDLELKTTLAQRRSAIDLGFTEPYFLDRDVAAGFDLFKTKTDLQRISSYDAKTLGAALRANYPLTENLRQGWRYTLKESEVTNIKSNASRFIRAQEGTTILSEVTHFIAYDRRDNRFAPTEGYFARLTTDVAGLGGTMHYVRNRLDGAKYYPLSEEWVLALKGITGYIFGLGEDVRLPSRFFVGGDDLRGFATGGIGPRDRFSRDAALGGEWMYVATAEVTFPIGLPTELGIRGKLFTDLGSAGKVAPAGPDVRDTGSIRMSAGTGVSWISPFGAIGLDIGVPLVKESFDQVQYFRFNFGTRF